jgi:hypothetical protein
VKGKSYQLVVHSPGYDNKSFMLPRAKESGIVLHIQPPDGSSHVYFELSRSEADKEKYNRLKLVFQMQGARIHITDIDFDRGLYGGMLKLDQWPSGIMQVTVFDTTGLPLAERLFFVRHSDQLDVQLNIRQLGLKSRAKNTFQITWPQSVGADFSISVTDEDMIRQSFNGDNIISNLLLTSDIKGEVYHPGWYFRNEDSATLRGLDLVMMTNGWRRFTWEKILNNQFPKIVFPADTAGLVIKGRALSMDRGTINMIIKSPSDSVSYYVAAPVNQLGDFMISNLNFHDTAQLYFQGLQGKDETIGDQIHLNGSFLDNLTQVPISVQLHPADIDSVHLTNFLDIALERNHSGYISDNSSILLNEVTVTGRIRSLIQQLDDRYSSPSFKESAYKSFDLLDDTIANPDILAFLEGQIGLSIYTDNQGIRHPVWKSCQPSIYLNEQLTNVEEISTLPLNEIALIKVFQPPFSAGSGNDKCGAIAVYSRKGSDRNMGGGLLKGRKMGYSLVRQFYSPDYEATNINHDLNDERTTLYWNPDLRPDNISHSTTVSFFNNDFTKRYHVVIEGMDNTGKIGRLDTVIEDK